MKRSLNFVMAVILSLFMFTATTPAQEIYTSITGVVTDPTGAVVPGATVTVINESSGVSFTTQTDNTGRYTVLRLVPGKYTVRVEAAGFRTAVLRGIELVVAVRGVVNVQLEVGEVTEVEVVEFVAPSVEINAGDKGAVGALKAVAVCQPVTGDPCLQCTFNCEAVRCGDPPFFIFGGPMHCVNTCTGQTVDTCVPCDDPSCEKDPCGGIFFSKEEASQPSNLPPTSGNAKRGAFSRTIRVYLKIDGVPTGGGVKIKQRRRISAKDERF